MKDDHQIRFNNEGDQAPGMEAGDVVIVLDQKDHDVFTRRGMDLIMEMELNLTEALCGFERTIKSLDGRTLLIKTSAGEKHTWLLFM